MVPAEPRFFRGRQLERLKCAYCEYSQYARVRYSYSGPLSTPIFLRACCEGTACTWSSVLLILPVLGVCGLLYLLILIVLDVFDRQ